MNRFATLLLASFLACGGALPDVEEDALSATLGPQSLTHGTLGGRKRQLSWTFRGKAGEVIAPDVWPTGGGPLRPTLTLLGPRGPAGRREVIARGAPRSHDPGHLAIDGFRLPGGGDDLLLVGLSPGSPGGKVSLRLWMQSSHLPRQETSQVDLTLAPGAVAQSAVRSHADAPHPWADDEVDAVVAEILGEPDVRVAVSSAQVLLSALRSQEANDAQRSRANAAAARVIGSPQHFRSLDAKAQAFALWWLSGPEGLLFADGPEQPPARVAATVAQLVAAWPGARQDGLQARAKVLDGVVYGWQVDWSAVQADLDGAQVWVDFSREWFDAEGQWLAEQSPGASEPDDE